MNNALEDVLEKIFRDEKIKYYHPADSIFNDQYIRWDYLKHQRDSIVITIGSNDGETDIKVFTDSAKLGIFLELILY